MILSQKVQFFSVMVLAWWKKTLLAENGGDGSRADRGWYVVSVLRYEGIFCNFN
jgi:hypothetical protein